MLSIETRTINLPGNRTLVVAVVRDGDRAADADVVIAAGFPGRDVLPLLASGVRIPAEALPELQSALDSLNATGANHG
jgi:hypothetical protein